jgi:hypothetical protein
LKGYQTKLLMPLVRFYYFKCAIYLCACLCVFIYPCIYLCYMTVSAYDLCLYGMYIYLYADLCMYGMYIYLYADLLFMLFMFV